MISVRERGDYCLIETYNHTKIIVFNNTKAYAWIAAKGIGEILVTTHKKHNADNILAIGKYRLYSVRNEEHLSDTLHLELSIGRGNWQGYILPTGLPTELKKRNKIIPTKEIISKTTGAASARAFPYYVS